MVQLIVAVKIIIFCYDNYMRTMVEDCIAWTLVIREKGVRYRLAERGAPLKQ